MQYTRHFHTLGLINDIVLFMQRTIHRKETQQRAAENMRGRGGTPAFTLSIQNREFDLSGG